MVPQKPGDLRLFDALDLKVETCADADTSGSQAAGDLVCPKSTFKWQERQWWRQVCLQHVCIICIYIYYVYICMYVM